MENSKKEADTGITDAEFVSPSAAKPAGTHDRSEDFISEPDLIETNDSASDCETFEDAMDALKVDDCEEFAAAEEDSAEVDDDALPNESSDPSCDHEQCVDSDECVINEETLKALESKLTDEEKQERKLESRRLKDLGNERFKDGCYEAAIECYTDALTSCLMSDSVDRAVIYSNRAAAYMKLEKYESAVKDSSKALEHNPDYMKALLRRAELYERTEKLDEALEDYKKALERDPSLHQARAACMRLPDQINERNEKLKTEMMGKLKDLGNLILRPFGLSTDNFKLQQDPATGSYSVNFQQSQQH